MSELATLEERLKLVELSATLQRETIRHRLVSIEARPAHSFFTAMWSAASRPLARQLAFTVAVFAWRALRSRGRRA